MGLKLPLLGGCACGAVRYRVSAQPLMTTLCHCTVCQKRTGSAYSMNLLVRRPDFALDAGVPITRETVAGSGGVNVQFFCGDCLVRTHTEPRANPALTFVRPGTLDAPREVRPIVQIWTSSARPEALLPDIASFPENLSDAATLIEAWRAAHPVEA